MNRQILVLNLGSTSFKFKYYPCGTAEQAAAFGAYENLARNDACCRVQLGDACVQESIRFTGHLDAFNHALQLLQTYGFLGDLRDIAAVCYKAVHAGSVSGVQVVDDSLLRTMNAFLGLAPVHNRIYISLMEELLRLYPDLLQLAVFETSFHATIPDCRSTYGVPLEWKEKLGIRRYGFHGASHHFIADTMRNKSPYLHRIISLHLGGSSSACAIAEGKSIACSMGATPQSGLLQGSRTGDFDLFCLPLLLAHYNVDLNEILRQLTENSGLLGISGLSSDMRDLLQATRSGDCRSTLAVTAYVDGIIGYIGMFHAFLQGVQAIVFTGGIGRNSVVIRKMVCDQLSWLGAELNEEKNEINQEGLISSDSSQVSVYVLETDEEQMLVKACEQYLDQGKA